MELAGKWWRSDVALQIHATLIHREQEKKRVFQGRSPQLAYRGQLVEWITTICERHKLGLCSLHLAVHLLDYFMDNFDVSRNQLNLVAMGCLSVAAKFEEKEEDIPKQNVLSHYCQGTYAPSDFLQMELMLLNFFDWEVGLITPGHFINFYLHFTCPEMELKDSEDVQSTLKLMESIKSYARYFMAVCITYHHFYEYQPSLVGAAAICATRRCLGLNPVYPLLQNIHTFNESDLNSCERDFMLIHERDKMKSPTSESRRSKPETSTPEGTPEGAHVATKLHHRSLDDSVYTSDFSLDESSIDAQNVDARLLVEAQQSNNQSRHRRSSERCRPCSPDCSPIPTHGSSEPRVFYSGGLYRIRPTESMQDLENVDDSCLRLPTFEESGESSSGISCVAETTNDSGVCTVAEDYGIVEEECYDQVIEDEVFLEDLQPAVNPSIRQTGEGTGFVFIDKPQNVQIFPM